MGPIDRSRLSPRVIDKIDKVRFERTRALLQDSPWIAAWGMVVATLASLAGAAGVLAFFYGLVPLVALLANHRLVYELGAVPLVLGFGVGLLTYCISRATHPRAIRDGFRLHGPLLGLGAAVLVTLAAAGAAMAWSFPRSDVLSASSAQALTFARDHDIVHGSVYQEPQRSLLYFETTIGAYVEVSIGSGHNAVFDAVTKAAGTQSFTTVGRISSAVAGSQVRALEERARSLWVLVAGVYVMTAITVVVQRRLWGYSVIAPDLDDETVRGIVAAENRAR
jgi:hypothetical protein